MVDGVEEKKIIVSNKFWNLHTYLVVVMANFSIGFFILSMDYYKPSEIVTVAFVLWAILTIIIGFWRTGFHPGEEYDFLFNKRYYKINIVFFTILFLITIFYTFEAKKIHSSAFGLFNITSFFLIINIMTSVYIFVSKGRLYE